MPFAQKIRPWPKPFRKSKKNGKRWSERWPAVTLWLLLSVFVGWILVSIFFSGCNKSPPSLNLQLPEERVILDPKGAGCICPGSNIDLTYFFLVGRTAYIRDQKLKYECEERGWIENLK